MCKEGEIIIKLVCMKHGNTNNCQRNCVLSYITKNKRLMKIIYYLNLIEGKEPSNRNQQYNIDLSYPIGEMILIRRISIASLIM